MRRSGSGAIFLDRDGVINACPKRSRYLTRWSQFRFLPGALQAIRTLTLRGETIFIISNQAGVGRGLFSRRNLREITRRMLQVIRETGGSVQGVYYCTHRPEAGCRCRKPGIGLLEKAARRFQVDLKRSTVVGDHEKDIRMGRLAGCKTILLLSGESSRRSLKRFSVSPDRVCKDLREAVKGVGSTWHLKRAG